MPRQPRIQYEGAICHVMARGYRRQAIFADDRDRELFMATLGQACERAGWHVQAWVLMGNHYHLLLQTPRPTLVAGMQWLQNTYTRRFNARHRLWGRVFGDRYKAVLVEDDAFTRRSMGDSGYFGTLVSYLHLNPARAGVTTKESGGLCGYRWSSLSQGYAAAPSKRPPWLRTEMGFGAAGVEDTVGGRRRYVAHLERTAGEEREEAGRHPPIGETLQSTLERGWYWGSRQFRDAALERREAAAQETGAETNRTYRSSGLARDHAMRDAERIVREGCAALELTEEALANTPGSDPRKVAIASVLHRQTGVAQRWIAEQLAMRSAANVSQQVLRFDPARVPPAIREWVLAQAPGGGDVPAGNNVKQSTAQPLSRNSVKKR